MMDVIGRAITFLDKTTTRSPSTSMRWAKWFEDIGNRIVDYTEITSHVFVSTVFLGIDHRLRGDGPPILFETMIFGGGRLDDVDCRYSSWDDAATGHKVIVDKLRAKQAHAHNKKSPSRSGGGRAKERAYARWERTVPCGAWSLNAHDDGDLRLRRIHGSLDQRKGRRRAARRPCRQPIGIGSPNRCASIPTSTGRDL